MKRIDIFRNSSDCRCCFFSCESSAQEPIASLLSNHRVTLAVAPLLDNHGCTGASENHRSCATAQRHAASNEWPGRCTNVKCSPTIQHEFGRYVGPGEVGIILFVCTRGILKYILKRCKVCLRTFTRVLVACCHNSNGWGTCIYHICVD